MRFFEEFENSTFLVMLNLFNHKKTSDMELRNMFWTIFVSLIYSSHEAEVDLLSLGKNFVHSISNEMPSKLNVTNQNFSFVISVPFEVACMYSLKMKW
jgi:hypothetical protein